MALYRIVIIGFLLAGIDNTTFSVLEENIMAGVYAGGSDSIGIPIFGTKFLILFVSPFLYSIAYFPKIVKKIYSFKNKCEGQMLVETARYIQNNDERTDQHFPKNHNNTHDVR